MSARKFTPDQIAAILARGNTLVIAGAGAGKTRTLVEKCIRMLLGPDRIEVGRILVVTFTEAAAAEVRERIRIELEQAAEAEPLNDWIQLQLAGLDTAHICTLHSFCLSLLRENFFELDLDPAVSVLPAEQAEMLFHEVFDDLLKEHFELKHQFSVDLQNLIAEYFGGWEKGLREFIRKVHHYTQTRPRPEEWFTRQIAELSARGEETWREWYEAAVEDWCRWWTPYLESLPADNENAKHCAQMLKRALKSRDLGVVNAILARRDCWPKGKKTAHSAPFWSIFDEAEFLDSLREPGALENDWEWHRSPLLVLLKFAQQFSARFESAKRSRGAVDFHDLEQGALRLLWTAESTTAIASRWRERLRAVFVDEYQDINAAQDLILRAVSRDRDGNRFLVGDIKQSIYAFRQADPTIFADYLRAAERGSDWKPVFLSDNFRSHEGILKFINPLFGWLMQERFGGIVYDETAALKFGAAQDRTDMMQLSGSLPVEFHLVFKGNGPTNEDEEEGEEDLQATESEARHVAARLRQLMESKHEIFHQKERRLRPVEWRDMVVLLRAASGKVEIYAKAFAAMGVPLETKRIGFFSAQEVLDLCNLLTILDNPLQDIPLVAVLRSPLVGLSANELASIRVSAGESARSFWAALNLYLKKQNETSAKLEAFLQRYHRWRNPRQCFSLAQRLEIVLAETGYAEWLLNQERGRERYANVQQLVRVARQFDDARGESLYLFLRHIQELQETAGDMEPAAVSAANAVRVMTVHQSKGLEFPVVVVADLGKQFNTSDQKSSMVLHERFGICAMIKAPGSGARYPSLPLWLAQRDLQMNAFAEEMRVLYVALTRAENLLLLFGSATEKRTASWADALAGDSLYPQQLLKTRSWLDWIGMHTSRTGLGCLLESEAAEGPFALRIHRKAPAVLKEQAIHVSYISDAEMEILSKRLEFTYSHAEAMIEPAKTSVSAVRKRNERDEGTVSAARFIKMNGAADARSRGLASHTFLQHLNLRGEFQESALRKAAEALVQQGSITSEELKLIDFAAVAAFWESEIGLEIRARWSEVKRELPFTFKLTRQDLEKLGINAVPVPAGEFVVTQGVADLVLLAKDEIWLIDFKTDLVTEHEVAAKTEEYRVQITLYSLALETIYRRPVSRRGLYFLTARKMEWLN